jgi:predicted Zn-dependent protease
MKKTRRPFIAWITLIAIAALPLSIAAQTQIKYHSNKFSIQDDVKLGRQAAQEAEQQFPLLNDEQVRSYVERVGERLVAAIPQQFQHPEFDYFFKVVNARDINAFALPGGPMYVNRGMIEAARTEGEMAGVMAHEISHVALRHGTAQATKSQKYGTLAAIAGIAGAIITRNPNVGQLAQAPFAVYLLKFSREYETEADVLGAQIMAAAGYDPRDLANMFRTIEQQGGGGGGFLSDHPSPSDRYARINREAQYLRVNNASRDTREFARVQERLQRFGTAPTMAEIARSGQRYPTGENTSYPNNMPAGRVAYPSSRYQNVSIFNGGVRVNVPSNWRQINEGNSVWFAPEGGYGSVNGQAIFTHGANFGVAQTNNNRNLQRATDEIINNFAQGNRNLRSSGGYQRTTIDGRQALWTNLSNVNEATGRPESIRLITTQLSNGQIFYMVAVAPQGERNFDSAFNNVLRSVRIND